MKQQGEEDSESYRAITDYTTSSKGFNPGFKMSRNVSKSTKQLHMSSNLGGDSQRENTQIIQDKIAP